MEARDLHSKHARLEPHLAVVLIHVAEHRLLQSCHDWHYIATAIHRTQEDVLRMVVSHVHVDALLVGHRQPAQSTSVHDKSILFEEGILGLSVLDVRQVEPVTVEDF